MRKRDLRTARLAVLKRVLHKADEFDAPVWSDTEPMSAEDEAQFATDYQLDVIAEHNSPRIPGAY